LCIKCGYPINGINFRGEKKMLFGKKTKNNRVFPRAEFYQPSYFIVENEDNRAATECWFNNISLGGLAFESERDNLSDSMINILYKIGPQLRKDKLQVKFSKKLMTKWRYGCQFVNVDEQRNSIIAGYVDQKIMK
jgi:hypothetical protein